MEILIQTLLPGESFSQTLSMDHHLLDIALGESLRISETTLPREYWQIQQPKSYVRQISNLGIESGSFVSVTLVDDCLPSFGKLSVTMIYDLLQIIRFSKKTGIDISTDMSAYANALIGQIRRPIVHNCLIGFHVLNTVFNLIEDLHEQYHNFPTHSKLIQQSGLKKHRFQLACKCLYGQSLKSILQHLKMKKAFQLLVKRQEEIRSVSFALGYRYPNNLITAFHDHFGLPPTAAMTYDSA